MKIVTLILLFCVHTVTAQVKVNEIRMKSGSEFHKAKDPDVIYPVMSTGNKQIDDKINFFTVKQVTSAEDSITDISKSLFHAMNEWLTELDYEILINTKDILSLQLNGRGCGAHCSDWSLYFTFELQSGEPIRIEDIIRKDMLDSFKVLVHRDKVKALEDDKKEKAELLAKKEIDSLDYETTVQHIDENCIDHVNTDKFKLSKHSLEIIDPCEFGYALRSREPVYHLEYSFQKIKKYIDPVFAAKLK